MTSTELTAQRRPATYKNFLGRTTKTVAGHASGGGVPASLDQTTDYTYDGENHVLLMTAEVPGGTSQHTQYIYGFSGTGGYLLDSNDLLAQMNLPNPSTGLADGSSGNYETYGYDNLGEKTKTLYDENGTIRAFNYDVLGRLVLGREKGVILRFGEMWGDFSDALFGCTSGGSGRGSGESAEQPGIPGAIWAIRHRAGSVAVQRDYHHVRRALDGSAVREHDGRDRLSGG